MKTFLSTMKLCLLSTWVGDKNRSWKLEDYAAFKLFTATGSQQAENNHMERSELHEPILFFYSHSELHTQIVAITNLQPWPKSIVGAQISKQFKCFEQKKKERNCRISLAHSQLQNNYSCYHRNFFLHGDYQKPRGVLHFCFIVTVENYLHWYWNDQNI